MRCEHWVRDEETSWRCPRVASVSLIAPDGRRAMSYCKDHKDAVTDSQWHVEGFIWEPIVPLGYVWPTNTVTP